MAFRFSSSARSVAVDSKNTSSNCSEVCSRARCRFSTVSCRGNKRILQFVREPARQFAPGGDAFGLHQALALLGKLARHFVERVGELADFIARVHLDARFPVSRGDFARACGKLLRSGA